MYVEIVSFTLLCVTLNAQKIKIQQPLPSDVSVNIGDNLSLECVVSEKQSSIVQWRVETTQLIISSDRTISSKLTADIQERYSIIGKNNQFTLQISKINKYDEGIYQCGYIDAKQDDFISFGSINVTTRVSDVYPVCAMDADYVSSTLTAGSQVALKCSIESETLSTGTSLQWVTDEGTVKTTNQNPLSLLLNIRPDDVNKLFVCQLYSTNSTSPPRECSIRILENPVVLSHETIYAKIGSTFSLRCDVRSSDDIPTWSSTDVEISQLIRTTDNNRALHISNVTYAQDNAEIVCSYHNYTQRATLIVYSEPTTNVHTTTSASMAHMESTEYHNHDSTRIMQTSKHSRVSTSTAFVASETPTTILSKDTELVTQSSTVIMNQTRTLIRKLTVFKYIETIDTTIPRYDNATISLDGSSNNSSPTDKIPSGFQAFLQMMHMSFHVFIAAGIGTFLFLVFLFVLIICCYKYIQSRKPARLTTSDSFYSGLANVHKNINYPLHYNVMHKRSHVQNSTASSVYDDEDDIEGNLLEIIVQGKFPECSDMQFSDTLEHCNQDDSCLSSSKDFCDLHVGSKDYGTSADTLDGTDEGICSGSGETGFDFDFESLVIKQNTDCHHIASSEKDSILVKDTLC